MFVLPRQFCLQQRNFHSTFQTQDIIRGQKLEAFSRSRDGNRVHLRVPTNKVWSRVPLMVVVSGTMLDVRTRLVQMKVNMRVFLDTCATKRDKNFTISRLLMCAIFTDISDGLP